MDTPATPPDKSVPKADAAKRGGGAGGGKPAPLPPGSSPAAAAILGPDSEWKEKVIQIRRVTKVVKGGKKMSFRSVVIVGNGDGMVGLGLGKSNEVVGAIQKAVAAARKNVVTVALHKKTIPHAVKAKASGSLLVMRPASEGTGVIAGGAARAVFELAGIGDILSKSIGSNSPLNVARAAINGLSQMRSFDQIARNRGLTVSSMLK